MQKILKELEQLGGIHHSCLLKGDLMVASTFPDLLENNLLGACRVAHQIFMAVEGMGCSHREIFIELEENLLVGYFIADETVLALLTDKDVNLALINTSVRSALPRIKRQLIHADIPVLQPAATQKTASGGVNQALAEAELMVLMGELQEGLAEYIGPAAEIVFDDAYDHWKHKHGVHKSKIAELIKALASEIEDKADRTNYLQVAVNRVRAFSAKLSKS
ncbi:hypothetical protein [Neptunomonas antarctica]|uniref:Predicted regulator of Ras-like GTPase activity, Roadblock/LC7/MglB family n=1 Tax=Neptunomonas antarctica TaxID=619304 RepID=A0A1N7IRZ3_9GAMM|nr:hypothetical protein [Neptunomonas antarctica]SIS39852.1 Predicted regulator of Ras-like GTPase activity, Roadblock/LC7/MglB family [Neptunomonas antarctica]